MQEAGVSFVTLGVFSWSWLEPTKGEYEFGWLDEVMDLLADARHRRRPRDGHRHAATVAHDRLPRGAARSTATGTRLWPGGRQAWCPSLAGSTATSRCA